MQFGAQYPALQAALEKETTVERLQGLLVDVIDVYDELATGLPDDSGWKRNKPENARNMVSNVAKFQDVLGLSPIMAAYVTLACASHDLGRMVQGLKRALRDGKISEIPKDLLERYPSLDDELRTKPYDDSDEQHGYESVLLLEDILEEYCDTDSGDDLLVAVQNHSFIQNPTLEMCEGSEEALGLVGVLRDIDRAIALTNEVESYTQDPERKERERNQNFKGGCPETGRIDPQEFLDVPITQPVNRQQSLTYEAYMLQFLKWTFNFTREDMQDATLANGGPQKLAAYLLKQLEATPEQRETLVAKLRGWRDGILLPEGV